MTNVVATVADLEIELGVEPDSIAGSDRIKAQRHLDEVVSLIEEWLGRRFGPVQIVDEPHYIRDQGILELDEWPIVSIDAMTIEGDLPMTDPYYLRGYLPGGYGVLPPGQSVHVTYTVGLPAPLAVRAIVVGAVVLGWTAPKQVGTGLIASYSVEGTSITYGSAVSSSANSQGVGRFAVADLRGIARLRHRVMVT